MNEILPRKYEGIKDANYKSRYECVGCGFCCIKAPCEAARRLYGSVAKCRQLEWIEKEGRYRCGLMMFAGPLGEQYRKELHAGAGCCSNLNSWRRDVKRRDLVDMDQYWNPIDSIFQMFLKSLATNFVSSDKIELTIYSMEKDLKLTGYSDKEISQIRVRILMMFTNNQSSFMKQFMG